MTHAETAYDRLNALPKLDDENQNQLKRDIIAIVEDAIEAAVEERNKIMEPNQKEYGFVLIRTPEDKKKFSPMLNTDDVWLPNAMCWDAVATDGRFYGNSTYRRRISVVS